MRFKKYYILGLLIISTAIFIFFDGNIVSAALWESLWDSAGGEETVAFLDKYQDYLSYSNFITGLIHWFGWAIIKGLYILVDSIEGLIPQSLDLLSFLDDSGLSTVTTAIITDLVVALMVIMLAFIGIKTIIAKEPPNFKSVGVNILISSFLIVGLPTLMDTMEELSIGFYDSSQTSSNGVSSLSWNLIEDNTTDLLYVASQGFSLLEDPGSLKNNLSPRTFKLANLNATITPDMAEDAEEESLKHLAYKLDTNESGEIVADKIKGGAFSFFTDSFDEGYFRFDSKFIPIFLGLLALLVAYIFTIFVFIKTIIELGFKQIFGLFVFATDLESGQKTKLVMSDILNAFLLIAFTGLSFRLYTVFITYLGTANLNLIIYVIAMITATFILIQGSNTVMRYFGIDVGLKDGMSQIAGAIGLGKMLGSVASKSPLKNKGSKQNEGQEQEEKADLENRNEGKSVNNSIPKSKKGFGNIPNKLSDLMGNSSDSLNPEGLTKSNNLSTGNGNLKFSMNADTGMGSQQGLEESKGVQQNSNNIASSKSENRLGANGELHGSHSSSSLNNRNQEILAEMKLKDTLNTPNKEIEIPGKMKTETSGVSLADQEVAATKENTANLSQNNLRTGSRKAEQPMLNSATESSHSIKQNTVPSMNNSAQDSAQNVRQNTAPSMSGSAQDTIQHVRQNTVSSMNNSVQDIVQNVRQDTVSNGGSSVPIVQDQIQRVQQVINKEGIPTIAQNAVQKIVQEVENNPSISPGTFKAKVIQELERSTFAGPTQRSVIQEVEKVFSQNEPRQEKIKQVVETTVENKTDGHSRIGSILGVQSVEEFEKSRSNRRRSSKFNTIKR